MALIDLKSDLSWYGKEPPTANNITDTNQPGFTANIMPLGGGRPASQFVGIDGNNYHSTSLLGRLTMVVMPNINKNDTKFKLDGNSFSSLISGFDNNGNFVDFKTITAEDSFLVDDVTFSSRGLASRKSQLANGTKFPIGPEGQIHQFDIARTGFSQTARYEDSYGVKHGKAGLAI